MANQRATSSSSKIRKALASTSSPSSVKTSRYRRDDEKAMLLRDNMRGLVSKRNDTLHRIDRLEGKLEHRHITSNRTLAKHNFDKELDTSLDTLIKSIGNGPLLF